MAGNIPIKCYCFVFGTRATFRKTKGEEAQFYGGGNSDEKLANLADVKIQAEEISFLNGGKAAYAGIDNIASFTAVPYENEAGKLYYYIRRAIHTDASERESSYGEIVVYKQEDLFKRDSFIKYILGFRFLTEDEIRRMDTLDYGLNSAEERQAMSQREMRQMVEQLVDVPAVNLQELPVQRRNCLCKVAELLLQGKKVMLRLPEEKGFVDLCNQVMLELFTLLPDVARPFVSFSTCRRAGDFEFLRDIQLLIVDKTVMNSSGYTLVDLDAPVEGVSSCIEKWAVESEENRKQINGALTAYKFTPKECYEKIGEYYDPANKWWDEKNPERRFKSYEEVVNAAFSMAVLWTKDNWEAFCRKLKGLIHYEKDEDHEKYGIKEMLGDKVFYKREKGDDKPILVIRSDSRIKEELETIRRPEYRKGLYQLGLTDEEFEEVLEEIMITKDTLKLVQEQKQQFDEALAEQNKVHAAEAKQKQEVYATEVRRQKQQFTEALANQEKTHAEELEKQRAAYASAVNRQNEAIEAQRKEEAEARRKDREELYARLDKIGQGIEESQQKLDGKMDTLTASIDGKISAVREQIRTENSQMEERLQKSAEENLARQESERKSFQSRVDRRLAQVEDNVQLSTSKRDLEKMQREQSERMEEMEKKLKNLKHTEGGDVGGGSNMAMGLAVAGCAIGLILVVLLVIGIVKFKPAMEYAKTEAEATDTPKPTAVPAPTDTPEPTFTPIPEVIPYERGKYVTVCNNFALILTEEGEGYWVYSNDLVSVKIRVRTAEEEVQEGEIPASDGKYILTVMKNADIQTVTDETEAPSETEISTPEVVNEEANRLYEAVTQALYEAAGFTPTPKPVEGSAIWAHKLLGLSEEVELSAVDTMNLSEELVALFGDKLEGTNTYLLKAGDVYLVLSKTEDLFEIVMAEADAYMEAEAEAEVDETEGDVEEEKLKVNCFKIIKIENSQYTLYIFAENIDAVEALFPTVAVEAETEAEGTEPTASAAEPSASPAA